MLFIKEHIFQLINIFIKLKYSVSKKENLKEVCESIYESFYKLRNVN